MSDLATRLRALSRLVRLVVRAAPAAFLISLLLEPLGFVASVVIGVWLKGLTEAVIAGDTAAALGAALALSGTVAAMLLLQGAGVRFRLRADQQIRFRLDEHLAQLAAATPRLELFERPDLLDRVELLRRQQERLGQAGGTIVLVCSFVARAVTALGLLLGADARLLVIPVLALAPVAAEVLQQGRIRQAEEDGAEAQRLATHLLEMATTAATAKEIKIFGAEAEVRRRYEEALGRAGRRLERARWRTGLVSAAAWLLAAGGLAGGVVLVAGRAAQGLASAGDVLLVLHVGGLVAGTMGQLAFNLSEFAALLRAAGHLTWLEEQVQRTLGETPGAPPPVAAPPEPAGSAAPLPVPGRLRRGIVLEGLSFRYPGSQPLVLRDVDLELPAGAVVALVGENGAGKTTLVKLLLRFYEPTAGRILVDGADLARMPVHEWRARCAAAFQDFVRFELVLREAVGVGDLSRRDDDDAVMAALRRAGAAGLPDRLPQGLDTLLGRTWGGIEPSGGQWQQIAVARGLMREHPLLLVLDEPTAAFDPEREHALFRHYAGAARERREAGAVTLLITHRFSTVRMADRIVVLDRGRVVEVGDHETLVRRGGLYAELYELQARAYRG